MSNNCFVCHGPDISSRKAELRLDQEFFAKSQSQSGLWPIRAGKPHRSEMYRRIMSDDPEQMMPPPETNRSLTAYEKALIGKWIEEGAEWKKHWAFILPENQFLSDNARHPIDQIIDQTLDRQHLQRIPQASNQQLIRRLSYLIKGLPPTEEDLAKNVEDDGDYEKYVNQLLTSPQYGERWARHWMDLARYAEGRGHEFDYPVIGAWRYRDYLIRAFNQDLPYDEFVIEQLAGDLLDTPRYNPEEGFNESLIGTLLLNIGEGKHSPVDTKDEEKIRIDNVIDVTSKTFLGLTVACARCHDHKFDDIPTTDYYALYGIFESSRAHLYPAERTPKEYQYIDSIQQLKQELLAYLESVSLTSNQPPASFISEKTKEIPSVNYTVLGDFRGENIGPWSSDGYCFGKKTTKGELVVDTKSNRAHIRISGTASSEKISRGLSGALRSPTFTIDSDYILFKAAGNHATIRIVPDNLQLIQDPIHGAFARKIESESLIDFISFVGQWKGTKAYIEIIPGNYYSRNGKGHYYRQNPEAWIEVEYVLALDSLIEFPSGVLLSNDKITRQESFLQIPQSIWNDYWLEKNRFSKFLQDTTFLAGMIDGDCIESAVFVRGDHRNLSEDKVPHRFLTALPGVGPDFPKTGSGRLALAKSIVDPENPLTSRIFVNRVWHHLFGKGIVTTVDNFGLQGTLPSHPELLDHLAVWFLENDWSVKKLIRYIVTSETFKQNTEADPHALEIDPENKLLHSFPLLRLEAEAIRDGILTCSDRLDLTMYGESIPLHLTDFLQGRGRPSESGPLDGAGRRSIYQALWRNFLPPFMTTFDMPIPFSTFGDRSETNVPAQSLTLLNDPFIREQAELWAKNLIKKNQDTSTLIESVYLKAFSRKPSADEIIISIQFINDQKEKYPQREDKYQLAWTDFCHSIFNMKEFIYLL
ncbi:MAG: PSD1 domain-containing protein [Saprospiraceae bacterium]|nr:PSD1 domain-containing protein [Saprospiraceae bacterium]